MKTISLIAGAIALGLSAPSLAHVEEGYISFVGVRANAPGGQEFRVRMSQGSGGWLPITEFCGPGSVDWGYIESTDSNYDAVRSLLWEKYRTPGMARLHVWSTPVSFAGVTLCRIDYVTLGAH